MTLEDFLKLPGAKVHDGGPCPDGLSYPIEVLLRKGRLVRQSDGELLDWKHLPEADDEHMSDIIAYREAQP